MALVTAASRDVGRGAAIGLAEAGFKVYATGRTVATADLPESVERLTCDYLYEDETVAAFARVEHEAGGLDVLVNCAWGGYERMVWTLPARDPTCIADGVTWVLEAAKDGRYKLVDRQSPEEGPIRELGLR